MACFCEAKAGRISLQAGFSRPYKPAFAKQKLVQTFVNGPISIGPFSKPVFVFRQKLVQSFRPVPIYRHFQTVLQNAKRSNLFVNGPIYRSVFQTCFCNAKAGPILNKPMQREFPLHRFSCPFSNGKRAKSFPVPTLVGTSKPAFCLSKSRSKPEMLEVTDFKFSATPEI